MDPSKKIAPTAADPFAGRTAFSIDDFCERNDVSRSLYFTLKRKGLGPREMALGGTIRITAKAELDWQAAREYPVGEEKVEADRRAKQRLANSRKGGRLAALSPRHPRSKLGKKASTK